MRRPARQFESGQAIALFAFSLVVLLLAAGLVVDVGYAMGQQRAAQNAADFSAMAGTRVIGESYTGVPADAGTDTNVGAAIDDALSANDSQLVSARYVDVAGKVVGIVGGGSIPSGAVGVVVNAKASWHPFFLGIVGIGSWTAGANATAMTPGVNSAGVMPVGINDSAFGDLPYCDPTAADYSTCIAQAANLTSGTLNLPGGFGWLKFGAQGKCAGFGLGMSTTSGCQTSQGFLQEEVGPPANSYGCCTDLTLTPDPQRLIGSLTGNKPADLSYYVKNKLIVWVPIWDTATSQGANGEYHIVGFGAIVFTGEDTQHGKWLTGVRVSVTYGNTPNAQQLGATGAVQLVH
jgi:Putative Flp pilus-assembly TadE/G-like